MNCPSCGRPLATGARTCVYCAHGTKFRPKEQLAVPAGTLPDRQGGFPWRRVLVILLLVGGVAAWFTPSIREKIQPLIDKVRAMF